MENFLNTAYLALPVEGEGAAVSVDEDEHLHGPLEQHLAHRPCLDFRLGVIELGEHLHAVETFLHRPPGEGVHHVVHCGGMVEHMVANIAVVELEYLP